MDYPLLQVSEYQVSLLTGFLPEQDPLPQLPAAFAPWEALARHLSPLLMGRRLRAAVEALPLLDIAPLEDARQYNRAMLLLTVLGNAYVWAEESPARRIPAALALPLWQVAEHLGLPPIVCHSHMALQNWQRLNPTEGLLLENLAPLQLFLGGLDEQWFYMVTVAIEAEGGAVVTALLEGQQAAAHAQPAALRRALHQLEASLQKMLALLRRMPENCDPYIFYHRVRPYVAGWEAPGVIYEGVSESPYQFAGGSAAQSPLLQAIDAGLGVQHQHPRTQGFLSEMRHYMLPAHRHFIESLEAGPAIRDFVLGQQASHPALVEAYNRCISLLDAFRQTHLEISVRYISQQARQQEEARGTGGTDFVPFLSESRKETRARRIP